MRQGDEYILNDEIFYTFFTKLKGRDNH